VHLNEFLRTAVAHTAVVAGVAVLADVLLNYHFILDYLRVGHHAKYLLAAAAQAPVHVVTRIHQ
jgi:hypothetical protein